MNSQRNTRASSTGSNASFRTTGERVRATYRSRVPSSGNSVEIAAITSSRRSTVE